MTYPTNHILLGTIATSLLLITLNLNGALPQNQEPPLKRSKNFNIKHSDENQLNDIVQAAYSEKNSVLGFFLYDEGWNADSIKNMATELAQNHVPPQNVFAIMQEYTNCIDDETLRPIILSSFIDDVLQQSVITGNVGYVAYVLTDPTCEQFILIEHIKKALKNLSLFF